MDSANKDDCPILWYARPENQPEYQCPYCTFYPYHEEQKICEVCQSQLSKKEINAFLNGKERDWSKYHLIRQGQLAGRDALENIMRARLVRERRCRRLCCAKKRFFAYVHCKECREILRCRGAPPELVDKEDEKSMEKLVSKMALFGYSVTAFSARVARGETRVVEGWGRESSSGTFVHPDRRPCKENRSPGHMV